MPITTKVARLAGSLHRRFRPGPNVSEPIPVSAPEPAAARPVEPPRPAFDPAVEELAEVFRRRVVEKWPRPEHAAFCKSDLNHVRRYALSMNWIPEGGGRILDP